jgi:putative ABC transport system permease protein
MTTRLSPPRLAAALLRWSLPPEDAETIAGDLEEIMRAEMMPAKGLAGARRWYWRQVLSVLAAHLMAPMRRDDDPPSKRATMAALTQDLSYAVRSLRKQPGLTTISILMLAIGIGATVAIFSLTFSVLYKRLPFADPERLMLVHLLSPSRDAPGVSRPVIWSYPKYQVYRDHQHAFASSAAFASWNWNMTGAGSAERVTGEVIDASYFPVLGIGAHIGRTFSADETRAPGSAPLAILGYRFWIGRFGGDPGVIGRTVGLNGTPHTIVGVMPSGFRGLTGESDLWVPLMTFAAADLEEKWNHTYLVVARRNPDVSAKQAQQEAQVLGAVISKEIGEPDGRAGPAWGATAIPLNDQRADPLIRRSVLLLFGAVAAVLLIVCLNLANLMLVRGLARWREVAIRSALGASRFRIVRQLMTESALLAMTGAVAGLGVAYGLLSIGAAVMPDLRMVLPRGQAAGLTRVGLGLMGVDSVSLLFAALTASATTVVFGFVPAWRVSRRDLTATMKSGAAASVPSGTRAFGARNVLMVAEMALALVLLTAGGLMLKSVARLQATELGFRPDSVLSVRFALPAPKYNAQRGGQFFEQLLARLDGQPGLDAVAFGSCPPLSGACNGTTATFPDRPPLPRGSSPPVGVLWASPMYFETLGIRLVRGRLFTDQDRAGQPKVVVVNETAARSLWKGEDPIGRRIAVGQGRFEDGAEVVGIVADVRYNAVEAAVAPDVYLPLLQSPRAWGFVFVRSGAARDTLVQRLRAEIQALDPDLPLTDVKMMAMRFDEATWRQRSSAWLLGSFAVLALVLAALGIYGVMSQGVEQRTREIGVRLALGAARRDILRLIIGRVFVLALTGIVVGVMLALPSMRLLTAVLYQVEPGDPWVFSALACVLLAVTLLAGYVPARRATRVDPLVTLRAE